LTPNKATRGVNKDVQDISIKTLKASEEILHRKYTLASEDAFSPDYD